MNEKSKKTETSISGVTCIVDTCYYHTLGNNCCASKIEIQPKDADTSAQTDCATFTPQ